MKSGILISLFIISILFQSCSEDEPVRIVEPVRYIEITNPAMNSNVPDSTTIEINSNINQLLRVELYIDNQIPSQEAIFTRAPYKYLWKTNYYEDGSQHILQAKGYDQSGDLTDSKYVIVNVYRFMPSNLQAFIRSDSLIELHWTDNCNFETGFEVEESINGTYFTKIADVDSNITSDTVFHAVKLNYAYLYRVRAVSGNTYSGYSDTARATVLLNTPTGLDINLIADTAATLSWQDNNDFETGYVIMRYNSSGGYSYVKEVPPNTTETIVQDSFVVGKYYDYLIYARMGYIYSEWAHFPHKNIQFFPPYNLKLEGNNSNSLTLRWQDDNSFGLGYFIERTSDGINYTEIGKSGSLSYTDNDLDTAFDYSYRVAAYSRYNKSDYSDDIDAFYANQLEQVNRFFIPYEISSVSISDDASIIAFGSNTSNEAVILYDIFTGIYKITLSSPDSSSVEFLQIAISPDNTLLAAIGTSRYVTVWDVNSGTVVHRIDNTEHPHVVKFSKDSKYLIVEKRGVLRFYDVQSWQYEDRITTPRYITDMGISPDGNIIATGDRYTNINLWDYVTGNLLREIPGSANAYPLVFNRDGTKLYSVVNTELRAWDVNTASVVLDISNFLRENFFAINEDENSAIYSSTSPGIGVFELSSKKLYQIISFSAKELFFSPDNYLIGRRVMAPSYYIWKLTKEWVTPIQ